MISKFFSIFMEKSLNFAIRHHWFILLFVIAITVLAALQLHNLKISTDIRHLIPEDQVRREDQAIREVFKIKDTVIIAIVNNEGAFNVETVLYIKDLCNSLQKLKDVYKIRSLLTEDNIESKGDTLYLGPFLKDIDENTVLATKNSVLDFEKVQGILCSSDLSTISLLVEFKDNYKKEKTVNDIINALNFLPHPSGVQTYISGLPLMESKMGEQILKDLLFLIPMIFFVAAFFLWIGSKSLRFTLICLFEILVVLILTLGLMAYLNISLYIILTVTPIILIGLSITDEIHIFMRYRELLINRKLNENLITALDTSFQMWRPILLTSTTTAAAFLAFLITPIKPLRYFGIFTAFGVMIAMIFSLYVTPSLLMLFYRVKGSKTIMEQNRVSNLEKLGLWLFGNKRYALGLILLISVISILGGSRTYIYDNWMHNFNSSDAICIADKIVCQKLAGSMALNIEIDTGKEGGLKDPNILQSIGGFQKGIEKHYNVSKTFSIYNIITRLHDSMTNEKKIQLSSGILGQYFFLLEGTSHEDFWDRDLRRGRITVFVKKPEYTVKDDISLLINEEAKKYLPGINITLGGDYILCAHWVWIIAHDYLRSLFIAGAIIFFISSLSLWSCRRGFIVMIPVVFAVLIMFGVLGLLGIPLGVATSMFGSIVLGLGIDYSVHFEHEYQRHKVLYDDKNCIAQSFRTAGKACFWDVVIIVSSFSILLFSSMPPIRKLGFIVSCTILASIISTYLLSPVILPYTNRKK